MDDTKGFVTLGNSNWTICGLINWYCSQNLPSFYRVSHNKPFLIVVLQGKEEGRRERELFEQTYGNQITPFAACLTDFTLKFFLLFYLASDNKPFLFTASECPIQIKPWYAEPFAVCLNSKGKKIGKKEFSIGVRDIGVSVLEAFKLDHLKPVELILSQIFTLFT